MRSALTGVLKANFAPSFSSAKRCRWQLWCGIPRQRQSDCLANSYVRWWIALRPNDQDHEDRYRSDCCRPRCGFLPYMRQQPIARSISWCLHCARHRVRRHGPHLVGLGLNHLERSAPISFGCPSMPSCTLSRTCGLVLITLHISASRAYLLFLHSRPLLFCLLQTFPLFALLPAILELSLLIAYCRTISPSAVCRH